MGRAYFPVSDTSETGRKLMDVARLLREAADKFREDVYMGADGQYDNSADDGGAIALLELAAEIAEGRTCTR